MFVLERYTVPETQISVHLYTRDNGEIIGSVSFPREDEKNDNFNAALDGIESLLLALACEGVDLREEKIAKAIKVSLDSISNNME